MLSDKINKKKKNIIEIKNLSFYEVKKQKMEIKEEIKRYLNKPLKKKNHKSWSQQPNYIPSFEAHTQAQSSNENFCFYYVMDIV